jgi:predicted secreted protein
LASNDPVPATPAATFRESDRGKTVSIAVGTRLCIELQENPTTGYGWGQLDFDKERLGLESDAYTPAGGTGVGGGGSHRFVFRAKARGATTIRFEYTRPWDHDAAPVRRFELTVVVSE